LPGFTKHTRCATSGTLHAILTVVVAVVVLSGWFAALSASPAQAASAGGTSSPAAHGGPAMLAQEEDDEGPGLNDVLSIGLAPVKTALDLGRGESRTFTATFSAGGNEPIHASVTYSDVLLRADSGFEFLEPGEEYWSAGNWLTVSPLEFDLDPGQRQELTVTVTVPQDVPDGEYYAAFLVGAAPRSDAAEGATVQVGGRLTSVICVAIGENLGRSARLVPYGHVPRADTGARGWDRIVGTLGHGLRCLVIDERNVAFLAEARPLRIFVPLENTCEVHVEPRVTASFYEGDSLRRRVIYGGEIILPGRSKVIQIEWPAPPIFGRFRLELRVEYGGPEPIEVERTFWILPVKGILGLIAVAFGLGYLSATRGRRGRVAAPPS